MLIHIIDTRLADLEASVGLFFFLLVADRAVIASRFHLDKSGYEPIFLERYACSLGVRYDDQKHCNEQT